MSNWWAKKLQEGSPAPRRDAYQPVQPPPREAYQQLSAARAPQSSRNGDACPECGSGNYMSTPGSSYLRCFDCGFPIQQSGSGVGVTKTDGDVHRATQVPTAPYSPGTIVGRIE